MTAPMSQPNMACGPPRVTTIAGMVTNGPMPHIWVMLMAVAWSGPIFRSSPGSGDELKTRLLLVSKVS